MNGKAELNIDAGLVSELHVVKSPVCRTHCDSTTADIQNHGWRRGKFQGYRTYGCRLALELHSDQHTLELYKSRLEQLYSRTGSPSARKGVL